MGYIEDINKVNSLSLPWEKLENTNILITGATGLIGSCLVEVLMARENRHYSVYAMGRNQQRMERLFGKYTQEDGFYQVLADVTQPLELHQKFHFIIHAASGAAPTEFAQRPVEVMKANINGVANLMEYGLQHDMRRLLYVSSGEVYGEGDGRTFTEDYSGYVNISSPRSCYPSSKRAAETLCVSYMDEYGVDVVIARPCHVYGPHFTESDNRVYAQFIRNVLRGEDIVMKSTGSQYRSWCYVVDCVSALLYILLKGDSGQAYNIADENSNISIRQLADMVAKTRGAKVRMELPSAFERHGYNVVSKSVFDTSKLETLGWNINGTLLDKLNNTIEESML